MTNQKPAGRVKTPTLLQMEAAECGAAALGIVLGHYGRFVPLERLRIDCGVSRDGVNARNLIQAAKNYGMKAGGVTKELAALRELPLPAILFWNFNHFLVLEGFQKDRVYLNDPATGPRMVSEEELDDGFTGVVLQFEPGEEFEAKGAPPSLIGPLRDRLTGSGAAVAFAIIAGLALVVPGLLLPIFARIFVDKILVAELSDWVYPLLIGMALTAFLRGALTWLQEHYLLRLETKLSISTSSRFFWHILRLPMEFYNQRYSGEIGSRVALNDRIAQMLSGRLASTAIDVVMIVFYAALMLLYDWKLTLIGVVGVILNFLALKQVARRREDGNRRLLQEQGKFVGVAMGGLQNMETLKAGGMESDFFARLAGHQATVMNAQQRLAIPTQYVMAVPPLITALTHAAVLTLGGYRVMQGELTMGMLVAFQSLMSSFITPVTNLVGLGTQLQEVQGTMNRLDDVLKYEVDPQTDRAEDVGAAGAIEKLSGHMEMKDITFAYSRLAKPLVENFNLVLCPGMRVALVGTSGSGKSTLGKLACGLYEPWQGDVLFDGKLRSEMPREAWTNSVAFVDQEIVLFEGTVRENVTLWDKTVPEFVMVQACKDALIHDEIVARPGGYDSIIEEGGGNLSGGQQQRLEIARALVNNPSILVLDEATSALDAVTELQLDENLRMRGCTCLIISHRLSTIRDCDEIVVLDKGEVVQRGTHTQLIEQQDGLYAQLFQA